MNKEKKETGILPLIILTASFITGLFAIPLVINIFADSWIISTTLGTIIWMGIAFGGFAFLTYGIFHYSTH